MKIKKHAYIRDCIAVLVLAVLVFYSNLEQRKDVAMDLPVIFLPAVYHVGTLDAGHRGPAEQRSSYEGAALSVSLTPDAWRRIAGLNGPCWALKHPAAAYLDAQHLDLRTLTTVAAWAEAQGLAVMRDGWSAHIWDEELEAWCTTLHESKEAADVECEDLDPELRTGGHCRYLTLTEDGAAASNISFAVASRMDCMDLAIILWAERVLAPTLPDLVGCWWRDAYEPEALSAPRGAVFQGALKRFQVEQTGTPGDVEDRVELSAPVWINGNAMTSGYRYVGSCPDLAERDLFEMTDDDRCMEMTRDEFLIELGQGDPSKGLAQTDAAVARTFSAGMMSIAEDSHVRFYASTFQGMPCLYVVHSATEVIFQRSGLAMASERDVEIDAGTASPTPEP